jgi:hypothetical protein
MGQIALPLAWPPDPGDDAFLVTPSNARAAYRVEHWGAWPVMAALLTGPRKSGRSLLARVFAAKTGGRVIDDAERVAEEALFHAWNRAQEERRPLLIVADAAPPAWAVALPDLRSRLAASPVIAIGAPDDALVRALLERELTRRGLDARPELVDWIARRIERSHLAVLRAADALDAALFARRGRLTVAFARTVLAERALIGDTPERP